MAKRRIQLDRLTIRLPRSAGLNAGQIASGLGREILKGVARETSGKTGGLRIENLSAGKFRAAGAAGDLQQRVADAVAAEVRKRLG